MLMFRSQEVQFLRPLVRCEADWVAPPPVPDQEWSDLRSPPCRYLRLDAVDRRSPPVRVPVADSVDRLLPPDRVQEADVCDCIKKINEELKEIPNTMLDTPIIGPQRTFVATCKRDDKVRGKPKYIFATYCPFCGIKYEEPTNEA